MSAKKICITGFGNNDIFSHKTYSTSGAKHALSFFRIKNMPYNEEIRIKGDVNMLFKKVKQPSTFDKAEERAVKQKDLDAVLEFNAIKREETHRGWVNGFVWGYGAAVTSTVVTIGLVTLIVKKGDKPESD